MIRVIFQEADDKIYVKVKGHSLSAALGADLICAGVSSVTTGALNALANPTSFQIISSEGLLEIMTMTTVSAHDQVVLHTMLRQLETIAEAHPQYLKINKKGT
jgi:hypothetical protein